MKAAVSVTSNGGLYSINPSTGAATYIGNDGIALAGSWRGLSNNGTTLYFAQGAGGGGGSNIL